MNKCRLIFTQTMMISTGILFGVGVQALIGWLTVGTESLAWPWYTPLSVIFTGFLCALGTLLLVLIDFVFSAFLALFGSFFQPGVKSPISVLLYSVSSA